MDLKIFLAKNKIFIYRSRKGWGEVSPLPSRSQETLQECLIQLQALQAGWRGPLYPSVAFALESADHPFEEITWPVAYLLMGSEKEIFERASKARDFEVAKLKVGDLSVSQAIKIAQKLKNQFRLRIDFNGKWTPEQVQEFCSYFQPTDFEFLEDSGIAVQGFTLASDEVQKNEAEWSVWKPTVKGIPKPHDRLILSSAWESGLGIACIAALAARLELPPHPIGIGTYFYLQDDLLEKPLHISKGKLHLSPDIKPRC